jgi:DNA-binding beta-propeller fold protein YncE
MEGKTSAEMNALSQASPALRFCHWPASSLPCPMNFLQTLVICSIIAVTARAEETNAPLTLEKTIPLLNVDGRIDHLAADVGGQRLFVAALGNNTVEVVDLKAGKQIQSLPGFAEPQGIAYVPEFDRLFVANGSDGTCRILDGHSFKTLTKVELGGDADNVRYDEKTKRIYVGYGGGALASLDAKTGAKIADIKLAAHPESFRLENSGPRLYVNVTRADQIVVIDRDKGMVTATWPLKEAKSNFPMILDEPNHRLFIGCRSPARVLVYNSVSGHLVASAAISRDTDDLFYDSNNKLLYVSCGGGAIDVIQQLDPDNYKNLMTLPTPSGARTSLFIPELKVLCLAVPHRGSQQAEIRVYKVK